MESATPKYSLLTALTVHAGLPASARRFSEIHTPHNLLPQQIVREEAIVYCQSINNLDCWYKQTGQSSVLPYHI